MIAGWVLDKLLVCLIIWVCKMHLESNEWEVKNLGPGLVVSAILVAIEGFNLTGP